MGPNKPITTRQPLGLASRLNAVGDAEENCDWGSSAQLRLGGCAAEPPQPLNLLALYWNKYPEILAPRCVSENGIWSCMSGFKLELRHRLRRLATPDMAFQVPSQTILSPVAASLTASFNTDLSLI